MSDILTPRYSSLRQPTTKRRRPDEAPAMDVSQIERCRARFMSRVDQRGPDECWLWTGYIRGDGGYGWYTINGWPFGAHRLAYVYANGHIGPSLTVDHLCRVRACCNPAHLEAITLAENLLRKPNPFRLTGKCRKGHLLKEMRSGKQYCPICTTRRTREYYANTKAACSICGKVLGRAYLPVHMAKQHGTTAGEPDKRANAHPALTPQSTHPRAGLQ